MAIMSSICNNHKAGAPANGDILCPNCGERLTPADIEVYAKCPFCDWSFQRDSCFEDFVMSPVVSRWMARAHNKFPRD